MPLSEKDRDMERSFERQYPGSGKSVYYATLNTRINEGRAINSPESRKLAKKRKHHRRHARARKRRV